MELDSALTEMGTVHAFIAGEQRTLCGLTVLRTRDPWVARAAAPDGMAWDDFGDGSIAKLPHACKTCVAGWKAIEAAERSL